LLIKPIGGELFNIHQTDWHFAIKSSPERNFLLDKMLQLLLKSHSLPAIQIAHGEPAHGRA
jgi:hypothetical protein